MYPNERTKMRTPNVEISSDRSSDTVRKSTVDTVTLGPVTEFLGIGILLALLLFS